MSQLLNAALTRRTSLPAAAVGRMENQSQIAHCQRLAYARGQQEQIQSALRRYDGSHWSPASTVGSAPQLGAKGGRICDIRSLQTPVAYHPGSMAL